MYNRRLPKFMAKFQTDFLVLFTYNKFKVEDSGTLTNKQTKRKKNLFGATECML